MVTKCIFFNTSQDFFIFYYFSGLIIAKNLPVWIKTIQSLRLSQVLDMYYSDRGLSLNKNIKACERGRNFVQIAPGTVLEEQVSIKIDNYFIMH